jgi:superfamily II DNA/RNA helicase
LVEAKVLSRATVHMISCRQPPSKAGSTWRDVYDYWVCGSDVRNGVITEMTSKASKPAMLFVDEDKHIAKMKPLLEAEGLKCEVVTGKTPVPERKRKLDQLQAGEFDVLIANVVFQKGIDAPKLRAVVNGAGKQSVITVLQRMGRGMRVDAESDKYEFECWDVFDKGQRWLQKHAVSRLETYRREGHPVVLDGVALNANPKM